MKGIRGIREPSKDEIILHLNELLSERENQLEQYEKGFKGACSTCEVVGEVNAKLEDQIKKLTHIINCVGHKELIGNEEFLKGTGFYIRDK